MRLEPRNMGGHENFHLYKNLFQSLYHDPLRPIFDVIGRRVEFKLENFVEIEHIDNAAHVCYGGRRHRWYKEHYFDVQRAERIEWIEQALSHPSKICHDSEYYANEKYLLRVQRNSKPMEYFCVITENLGKNLAGMEIMEFITAYYVDWRTCSAYEGITPFVYPESTTKNISGKKRGKKKKD